MLRGSRLLVTGVVTQDSIAFAVARRAQELGAEVLLTALPRVRAQALATAAELPRSAAVVDVDLTSPEDGGSLVELHFEASRAWPVYEWMGVCKAALVAANQYVARDLGTTGCRANLVAAGSLHAPAARAITGTVLQVDAGHAATAAPLRHERT